MLSLLCGLLALPCFGAPDAGFDDVDGPNVRIIRHADGSRTRFTRTPDNTVLTKKKYSPNGVITMVTIYRMDKLGNPLGCKIFDGKKELLFKVSYGYRKTDGKLVEERMFDARRKRLGPDGREAPVQRVFYVYDAQGNRSEPMVVNLKPEREDKIQSFEKRFGVKSSLYEHNPFEDDNHLNGRPLRDR